MDKPVGRLIRSLIRVSMDHRPRSKTKAVRSKQLGVEWHQL